MYAGFLGLKQSPFSIAPDPHYLFMSERHREALAHLLYGVQGGGGFVLLTGEIGAGKTTVCRCFLEQIPDNCRFAYIFNPKLTVGDLLKTICHEFQVDVKHEGVGPATVKDYLDPLNEYLLASHAAGQHDILIIDEAQNLTSHVLEQLRLLTNLETSQRKLLQIVLIGQPELRTLVAQPELEQLAQRVIARYHLGALSEAETRQYVRHRMEVAGLEGPLPFDDAALRRVHTIARGVPRRINLLCDRALLGAYATGQRQVNRATVERAATEVFDTSPATGHVPAAGGWRTRPWALLGLGGLAGAALATALALAWRPDASPLAAQAPAAATPPSPASPLAPEPTSVPAAAQAATTTPATTPAATTAPVVTPTASPLPPPIQGRPLATELLRNDAAAWRQLAPLWSAQLDADGDPCAQALQQQLQCYRTERMTLHGLRQIDRPAVLVLRIPGQGTARALLTGITPDSAILQAGTQRWQLPLAALAEIWRGDYATLWRTPPGAQGRVVDGARDGRTAPWLDQALAALQAQGQLAPGARTLAERLQAFQRARGIDADGQAGPMTFMQLNLVSGVAEPRLSPLPTARP